MGNVIVEKKGSILIVKLNRPKVINAIDLKTANELEKIWTDFNNDNSLDIGIITSTSSNFCSGADLTDIDSLSTRSMNPNGPLGMTRIIPKKPVIAAISGYCVAGGFEIALWADFRICEESSKFGFLERRYGVPLIDGGTQRLSRIAGLGNALYLILTGKLIDSREALRMGIVNEIVPDGKVLDRAIELAEEILKYPKETTFSDRNAVYVSYTIETGLMFEAKNGYYILESGIPKAGAKKFKEDKKNKMQ